MQGSKRYSFTLAFGAQTQTDDREGEIIHERMCGPGAMPSWPSPHFTGRIDQRPPIFSAIKVDGARAYDLARRAIADGKPDLRA